MNWPIVIFISVAATTLWSLWWQGAVRMVMADLARFSLFRLRDNLRSDAIGGLVDVSGFPWQDLDRRLSRMIWLTQYMTIGDVIEAQFSQASANKSIAHFDAEASEGLKAIDKAARFYFGIALIANSPVWVLIYAGGEGFRRGFRSAYDRVCTGMRWVAEVELRPARAPVPTA